MMKQLKKWLPSELIRIGRHITCYSGYLRMHFSTWQDAARHTKGYDAPNILTRTLQATLAVRDGKAIFERDF